MNITWTANWIEPSQQEAVKESSLSLEEALNAGSAFLNGQDHLRPVKELRFEFSAALADTPAEAALSGASADTYAGTSASDSSADTPAEAAQSEASTDTYAGTSASDSSADTSADISAGYNKKKACIHASAHGVYELYLNGTRLGHALLSPETTNYNKLIWYQTYDISGMLRDGINVLTILLADGWWIGRIGINGESCQYGSRLGFIGQIEIEGEPVIPVDESTLSRDSYIKYSDLYIGEKWDLTAADQPKDPLNYQPGSYSDLQPCFSADCQPCLTAGCHPCLTSDWQPCLTADWQPCFIADWPKDVLKPQPIPSITYIDEIPVRKVFTAHDGSLIADFGQVLTGVAELTVLPSSEHFPADASDTSDTSDTLNAFDHDKLEIVLEHSEVLDKDGHFKMNIIGRYKDQKDVLVLGKNAGPVTFRPHFSYHGFRYIKISGISEAEILSLKAKVIGTPLKKTAYFECDNELINKLQHAIEWSEIGNMVSIPTDCPQREKLGWTGDINAFAGTGGFLYDLKEFLRAWLYQLRLDQKDDGEVPVVIPNHPAQQETQLMLSGSNSSAAWSDACILVPWHLYELYGDASILEENFESMTRWLSYVDTHDWAKHWHFGDWLIPSLRELPDGVMQGVMKTSEIVALCYYCISLEAMINICSVLILGESDLCDRESGSEHYDESDLCDRECGSEHCEGAGSNDKRSGHSNIENLRSIYTDRLQKTRKHIAENFVAADGTVGSGELQGLYVLLLRSAAISGELKNKVLKKLENLICANDFCLDTGFASVPYLLDVLYDNGLKDLAYKVLFNEKQPGWLYMIKKGTSTIWENWNAIKEDGIVTDSSYNHYAYGCVGKWIYEHIGGLKFTHRPAAAAIADTAAGAYIHTDAGCTSDDGYSWALTDSKNCSSSASVMLVAIKADIEILKNYGVNECRLSFDSAFGTIKIHWDNTGIKYTLPEGAVHITK